MPRKAVKCHSCGASMKTSRKYVHCRACRYKLRLRSRENTHRAMAEGYCTTCRKFEADAGATKCVDCRERHRRYASTMRAEALSKGFCTKCWKSPARPGKAHCEGCATRLAEWHQERKAKAEREKRDADVRVLEALRHECGPMTLKELAEAAAVSTRSVLRHVRRLEPVGKIVVDADENIAGHRKVYMIGRGA